MAETITNEVYGDDYTAVSAGLCSKNGSPICYDARAALLRAGYDEKTVVSKRSRALTGELMNDCDVVVGVTAEHASAIKRRFPEHAHKITSLPIDTRAPSAGDEYGYDRCFETLCEGIEKLLYPDGSKWTSK